LTVAPKATKTITKKRNEMNFSEKLLNAANEGAKTKMEKDKKKAIIAELTNKSCQGNIHKTGMDEIWTCFECLIEHAKASERERIVLLFEQIDRDSNSSWEFEVEIDKIIKDLKGILWT